MTCFKENMWNYVFRKCSIYVEEYLWSQKFLFMVSILDTSLNNEYILDNK